MRRINPPTTIAEGKQCIKEKSQEEKGQKEKSQKEKGREEKSQKEKCQKKIEEKPLWIPNLLNHKLDSIMTREQIGKVAIYQ